MRYSKQRELIFNALKNNPVHPTADYLYALLKKENPALSLGTVYRNLNLLTKEGIIKKLKGFDGSEHFDHHTHNHCHFVCETCSRIEDIELNSDLYAALGKIKNRKDYHITACDVTLRGICKHCKENKENKK